MISAFRSLSLRVALIAAGGSALALLVAGAVFIFQFSAAVERNFDARLETLLLTLIAATDSEGGVDESSVEGRSGGTFSRPLSGWYWQSRDALTGQVMDWSESLRFDILPVRDMPSEAEPARIFPIEASGGRELRALEQLVTLADDRTFALLVAGDTQPMVEDIRDFRNSVIWWLGGLAVLLSLGTAALVRWGLWPLRRMRGDLNEIREGARSRLEGRFPSEIEPLVQDLNALIDSNREIVERSRTHVGNLAHALKTPLAVLQNEVRMADAPLAAKLGEQIAIMRDQVEHHLNRARIAAQANVIGAVTPVAPILGGLARVMAKVHGEKRIAIATDIPSNLLFRGEKQDLEEMTGNLLDNACKWAVSRVRISGMRENGVRGDGVRGDGGAGAFLTLVFDDDGPGLAPEGREAAMARGGRLDETKPGSGLGLSIVVELARIYGGSFSLEDSELGGLSARLTLPAAGSGKSGEA